MASATAYVSCGRSPASPALKAWMSHSYAQPSTTRAQIPVKCVMPCKALTTPLSSYIKRYPWGNLELGQRIHDAEGNHEQQENQGLTMLAGLSAVLSTSIAAVFVETCSNRPCASCCHRQSCIKTTRDDCTTKDKDKHTRNKRPQQNARSSIRPALAPLPSSPSHQGTAANQPC